MRFHPRTIACVSLFAVAPLVGCGGKQTMASKSAAAYTEAQKKGLKAAAGGEHGGHVAESGAAEAPHSEMAGMDHSKMSGMDHSNMPGMDHSTMDHSKMSGMDHSKMPQMDHSKMDHKNMPPMQHDMSAMEHGAMQHAPSAPPPDIRLGAPTTNAEIAQTRPAATLRQDEFDAPPPRDKEERP
ncbi:MAG: hypothetical protein AABO58_24995 [Acidobacteriota bacterium]